jgi:hypothetical protein
VRHRQLGTVHARLTGWMLLGSAPFSLLGVAFSTWLAHRYGESFEDAAAIILGLALIAGGVGFAIKTFVTGRAKSDAPFLLTTHDKRVALLTGAIGGFVVGLTSVGSGTFFGLVMLLVFPLTAAKVVGTDIFHAAALLWVAGAGHLAAGNVDLHATAWLLIGSIPGVLLGSQVSVSLPDKALRLALATTLTLAGLKLAEVPGAEIVIVTVLGAAVALLAALGIRRGLRALARPAPAVETD